MTFYRFTKFVYLAALSVILGLDPSISHAQVASAQINGVVTDSTGAVVSNANVLIASQDTGITRNVFTNQSGEFVAPALEPGRYSITITATGFRALAAHGIILAVGSKQSYSFALQVGAAAEQSVTVSSQEELVNTTNAEISTVIDETQVKDLPLNGRDPSSLVFLSSGVSNITSSNIGGDAAFEGGIDAPTSIAGSSDGGRQGSIFFILDGVPNMDIFTLGSAPFPNADATQEFRIVSNYFDAQYGFSPGAVVSIQTKSGTDEFHGELFEFLRNNDLNAANYFTHLVDPLKRSQFGGEVGGPVMKKKLFFFANYQGTRASTGSSSNTAYTPTSAMLRGDFSAIPNTLTGPFQTVNGKPNQVDPSLFSKGALVFAALLPLGQSSNGEVNLIKPVAKYAYDENTDRLDYSISAGHRIGLRSFIQGDNQPTESQSGNLLTIVPGEITKYYNELLSDTLTISPTLVNVFSGYWVRMDGSAGGQAKDKSGNPFCLSQIIAMADPPGHCNLGVIAVISAEGFGVSPPSFSTSHRVTWGFSNAISKTLGRHFITAGVDVNHQLAHEVSSEEANPVVVWFGETTTNGLADFLLGDVWGMQQSGGLTSSQQGWQLGAYAQDQFKLRPSLTLTAGVRWEPTTPPVIAGAQAASYIPGRQSTRFPNAPLGIVFIGDAGIPPGLMASDRKVFVPRLGVAWQPRSLPHTTFRAGFGLFQAPLAYNVYDNFANTDPFDADYLIEEPNGASPVSFDNPWAGYTPTAGKSPFPPFPSPSYNPPTNSTFPELPFFFTMESTMKVGTTEGWNASIEQPLRWNMAAQLAYVGNESYHQATDSDANPGILSVRINPLLSQIRDTNSNGTASYNSLQAGLVRQSTKGLQFQTHFTYSKTIDDSTQSEWSTGIGDPFNLRWDRGNSDVNFPFISVTSVTYQTPSLRSSNTLLENLFGTWGVSAVYTAQSGAPFSMAGGDGNDNSLSLQNLDRADVTGQPYNVRQGGQSHWLNEYYNPAAFKPNAIGTFGDSRRNLFQNPRVSSADVGLNKNWMIADRYGIQFRWEMFNALNHPSFAGPNNDVTTSSPGQITNIGPIAPRVMQGALKFSF